MSELNAKAMQLAIQVGQLLLKKKWFIAVAESCTGGLLAATITEIPGSSTWFERGYITYSNQAKIEMLGVHNETLDSHGAVSEKVVKEMAEGALLRSHSNVAIAISGIAGPEGGSAEKPVGLVWLAFALEQQKTRAYSFYFQGDRTAVRVQAIIAALEEIIKTAKENT